jgi:short subunit dehydrogenase-like uncharacterized protein
VRGPSDAGRSATLTHVWGEARAGAGAVATRHLLLPNGYTLTVSAAMGIVEALLRGSDGAGFRTPSQLMGTDYVLSLPGVALVEDGVDRDSPGLAARGATR